MHSPWVHSKIRHIQRFDIVSILLNIITEFLKCTEFTEYPVVSTEYLNLASIYLQFEYVGVRLIFEYYLCMWSSGQFLSVSPTLKIQ